MVTAERVRVLMAMADLPQDRVARAAGISPSTLSRALSGERRLAAATEERIVRNLVEALIGSKDA